jgi:nicotinate-nucleotide--dimethylbenzimidazole phosphoribosyltransferase
MDFVFAAHLSAEKGHRAMLRELGVVPLLDLGMRLGEGTGACLAMGVIEAAVKLMREMATFESAGVAGKIA